MAKMRAVAESAVTGLVTAVLTYSLFLTPAIRLALEIRRQYPDSSFSGMVTYYAEFVVMGTSLILAMVAARLIYLRVSKSGSAQG